MARANTADDEGIVWDTPDDEGIVWDEPVAAPKRKRLPTLSKTERFLQGLRDPIDGGAQLLERGVNAVAPGAVSALNRFNNYLADKTGVVGRVGEQGVAGDVAAAERAYQERAPEGVDWMRIVGNIASPANAALAARGASTIGAAARVGAGSAALNPVANNDRFWADKAKQVAAGAAGGAAARAVTGGAARVLSPNNTRNADLALLRREGVQPTIGQTLGGNWSRTEQKLTSLPIVGDGIANARGRALDQFNVASINRATAPINVRINEAGQAGVGRAQRAISHAYDDADNAMGSFRLDRQGVRELRNLRDMVRQLPPREQQAYFNTYRDVTSQMGPRGAMLPETFKRADSVLGKRGSQFSGSPDGYQQQLGDALTEMRRVLRDTGHRANPRARQLYEAADRGYANLTRVEGASNAAKLTERWTPGQLLAAVKQGDKSVRDRVTARGDSLMQDLGNAGQRVLGNTVPDSGTAGRAALITGGLGGGSLAAGLIEPSTAITAAIGISLGRAAYTPTGQRLLNALVSSRPGSPAYLAAVQGLRQLGQHAAPAGAQVGQGLLGINEEEME